MPTAPMLDKTVNHSPHVILLGAGASRAAFINGDANGKILPLMNDLIKVVGLDKLLEKKGIEYKGENFEVVYNELESIGENKELVRIIQDRIYDYFSKLEIPTKPTIYDYLILSLRKKDLIASFNWDPLLLQVYLRNNQIKELPQLAFLHGNVGMGVCKEHKVVGYIWNICSKCKKKLEPSRLLYPIRKKDYSSDPVIKDQWNLLRNHLRYAYMFTIFGYSAPVVDEDAKELMLDVWKSNKSLKLAEVELIDVKPKPVIEKTWDDFTFSHHYGIHNNFFDSYLARFPRRSCDAFARSSLMCKFLKDNWIPKFSTIADLYKWIRPLLVEEERYEKDQTPFTFDEE